MGPLYPLPARPPVSPPKREAWHREHPVLATIIALGIVGALLTAVLFATLARGEQETETGGPGVVFVRYVPSYPRGVTLILIDNDWDYRQYLNISVRPMFTSISVAFGEAACSGANGDQDRMVDGLGKARDAARTALDEAKRLVPPAPLREVHESVQAVFADTIQAADSISDCLTSGASGTRCQEAQEDTQTLMDGIVQTTRSVQVIAAGSVPRLP